jgi:hypothetical protein
VNSEEIEVSLRAEFESYLKEVTDGFAAKLGQLQAKIDEEIDRHKQELATVFAEAAEHFEAHGAVKPAFADIVVEHLKLARDEGSQISANAFAEAEKYEKEHAQPVVAAEAPVNVAALRDAVRDVSEKGSQVEILKALIGHAGEFAPRGAFFVLKNERFGGWRTFGHTDDDDDAIKQVSFSVTEPSVVNESVKDNSVKESTFGEYAEDNAFLDLVGFGEPEKMYAVPLVVRGRTVAVLYADSGMDGKPVNVDALDTLAQVASMRVELLASMKSAAEPAEAPAAAPQVEEVAEAVETPAYVAEYEDAPAYEEASPYEETQVEEPANPYAEPMHEAAIPQPMETYHEEEAPAQSFEVVEEVAEAPQAEWQQVSDTFEVSEVPAAEVEEVSSSNGFDFHADYQPEPEAEVEPSYDASPAPSFEGVAPVAEAPSSFTKSSSFETFKAEPSIDEMLPAEPAKVEVVQPVSAPRTRLSERNVDLPIEVSDEERRLHNDARRFARLLVSEIKLYNEQKVKEGRENGDIYQRLQEAVDRSREMYDKRVQPAVAGRFDYFHYELVNSLAEGEASKLGSNYPGATV